MKHVFVAKRKVQLLILLILLAVSLSVAGMFVPGDYLSYLNVIWATWLILAGWFAWSVIGKTLFEVETVEIPQPVVEAFDRFDESIRRLEAEQGEIETRLQDALTYQAELTEVLIGFIEQADRIRVARASIGGGNAGAVMYHDPAFGRLLQNLGEAEREGTLTSELGIIEAQENAYRQQATALLNRVIEARARIARQQVKLGMSQAAVPLLQMNRALGQCEAKLYYLNNGLPKRSQQLLLQ